MFFLIIKLGFHPHLAASQTHNYLNIPSILCTNLRKFNKDKLSEST